jgi:hypothetical protein
VVERTSDSEVKEERREEERREKSKKEEKRNVYQSRTDLFIHTREEGVYITPSPRIMYCMRTCTALSLSVPIYCP